MRLVGQRVLSHQTTNVEQEARSDSPLTTTVPRRCRMGDTFPGPWLCRGHPVPPPDGLFLLWPHRFSP